MAAPYSTVAISGYNSNPPADDGSTGASNRVDWSKVKTKIGDPVKTQAAAIDSALVTAFGKVLGGGGVTSTATDYTVQSTDQGKLVRFTGASGTVTTPDATDVTSPFVFGFVNNGTGSCTFDGNGSQTVDGVANFSVPVGSGFLCFTDGSNWFTTGRQGTLFGAQLMYGDIINGTIVESDASNAVTFSLKTLAGSDPSASDPVLVCFRNSTLGNGNYIYRTVTAATTLTISSTSLMGATNGVPFRLWLVLFDDAGTVRLGAINCLSGTNIYPLGQVPRASSTAEGGAGAADSAHVFYTGTAVSSKAYTVLGFASYESGLTAAGAWNASPTVLQLYGSGMKLPGDPIQNPGNATGALATGSTAIPADDTIPQNTEGDQYMSQAITPTSAANLLQIESQGLFEANAVLGNQVTMALFQDSTAGALTASYQVVTGVGRPLTCNLLWNMLAGTSSSTTFKIRAGNGSAFTVTFNGLAGSRLMGGVANSYLRVREIMA